MNWRRSVLMAVVVVALSLVIAMPASADPTDTTTSTTITPTTIVPPGDSSPGLFDIQGRVRQAIDGWFSDLVTSAINPALDLLGRSLMSAPDVASNDQVKTIWMISLGIADTCFVLLALIGGFVVMTHETVQTRYSVKEVLPRLVVAVIASNISLLLASHAIETSNALSHALLGDGVDPKTVTGGMGALVGGVIGKGGFVVLLAVIATGMALALVVFYIARAACVVLLVVAAPIALAFHALPQTEQLAMLWWRASAACLGIQIAQALVLITAIRVFFTGSGADIVGLGGGDALVDLLVMICLFWVMLRIPTWAGRIVFGSNRNPVTIVRERTVALVKTAAVAASA